MTDRDAILGVIEDMGGEAPVFHVDFSSVRPDLWEAFFQALEFLGGRRIDSAEFDSLLKRPRWCDVELGLASTVDSIWDAEVGFSIAFLAVASSGTVVLNPDNRLTSLVPPVNVIVIERNAIVPTLNEAFSRLPAGNVVFVTGPSRTADIEGVLVRGVHGPGEVYVYVRER